jgi:aminopeptidase-like protein
MTGFEIHGLAQRLWGINRSITGDGVRKTLSILKEFLPDLSVVEVPTGTSVFDWTIPKEWRVNDAYIISPSGEKICSFKENNLHLVGYSTPIHAKLTLSELQNNLYSLPEQPTAIPYITSYYKERWGFCLSQQQRDSLESGEYEVFIDSDLFDGSLSYGELLIKGTSDKEIFISTYVCHPSMANNELSGPTVTTFIAKWLATRSNNRYSYRFVFIPETIGSITYLSRNKDHLKSKVFAGFNVTCIGDDRDYSYLPSRNGSTISDVVSKHILKHICPTYKTYKWTDRGSDERQYYANKIWKIRRIPYIS